MIKKNNIKKIIYISAWIVFALTFLYLIIFIDRHVDQYLDSDMSSEMILGNILNQEGKILTTSWRYTTELRVLNTNLLYSFAFNFSDNWHIVRVLTSVLCYLVMAICLYYFCSKIGLRRYYPLIGICLFLPFSSVYMDYVPIGLYYYPHICISLITLGNFLSVDSSNTNTCMRGQKSFIWFNCTLAVIAGMGGLRQLLILYIPLFFATLYLQVKKYASLKCYKAIIHSTLLLFGSIIGYLINNNILSKKYFYMKYGNDLCFTDFNPKGIQQVITGFLRSMGYGEGKVFSNTLLGNALCAIIWIAIIAVIYTYFKNKNAYNSTEEILILYFVFSLSIFLLLYVFTNQWHSDRYNLPILIFVFPIIFIGYRKIKNKYKIGFCGIILLLFMYNCKNTYYAYIYLDKTKEKKEVAEFLLKNGYYQGYNEQDNVFVELSNGQIDIWGWPAGETEHIDDIDILAEYEQKNCHYNEKPTAKCFIIFEKINYQMWPLANKNIFCNLVYENSEYYVFGFNSYQELERCVYK